MQHCMQHTPLYTILAHTTLLACTCTWASGCSCDSGSTPRFIILQSRKRIRKLREGSGNHSLKWDADTFYCHTRICIFNFIIAYFISLYYLENSVVDYLCKTYILNSVMRIYWILLVDVWIFVDLTLLDRHCLKFSFIPF